MKIKVIYEATDSYSFRIDNLTTKEQLFGYRYDTSLCKVVKEVKRFMKDVMLSNSDKVKAMIISETTGEIIIELKI